MQSDTTRASATDSPAPPRSAAASPRASALADMYRHASALAEAGDLAAARAIHETIGRMLGDDGHGIAKVLDLASKRSR